MNICEENSSSKPEDQIDVEAGFGDQQLLTSENEADGNDILNDITISVSEDAATAGHEDEFDVEWWKISDQKADQSISAIALQENSSCCEKENSEVVAIVNEQISSPSDKVSIEEVVLSGHPISTAIIAGEVATCSTNIQTPSNNDGDTEINVWDTVQNITFDTKKSLEPISVAQISSKISFEEALNYFLQLDLSEYESQIHPHIQRKGLASFINFFIGPPKMKKNLLKDRNLIFCLALCPFDNKNNIHFKMIQTIYKTLTGNKFDCALLGNHWEDIGFQGVDPTTDFRGTGILGLICIMHFVCDESCKSVYLKLFKLSKDVDQNFPFCLIGINLTCTLLQILREDFLNALCNSRVNVIYTFLEMFCALFTKFYIIWSKGYKTIIDTGNVLKELESFSKKHTMDLLREYQSVIDASPKNSPQHSSSKTKMKEKTVKFTMLD